MKLPVKRWARAALATAFSIVLVVSASLIVMGVVNSLKTATLVLSAENQHQSSTVSPGDTVTLTAGISNQDKLTKGIVGLTMDIVYDSDKLTYVNGAINNLLGENFVVSANEADAGTVTVLIYADALDADSRLYATGEGNLFSLNFTVKDGAYGACHFTPNACNYADYTGEENTSESGFELIAVTPAPETASVTAAAKALTGISLTADPTLTYTYAPGLTFDKGNMSGTAFYNNGSTKTLTSGDFDADKTALTYADNGTEVTLSYTDNTVTKSVRKTLTVNKGILTPPTATAADYSAALTLGDIALSDSRWEWDAPNTALDCADSGMAFGAKYKDTNADKGNYSNETANVIVTVNKIAPVTPSLTILYTSGMTLSDVSLVEYPGWTWDNASMAVTEGKHFYSASYAGDTNYTPQTGVFVYVTATTSGKSIPDITANPTGSAIIYGQALSASELSGGTASVPGSFAWTNPADAATPNAGTAQRSVTFTPTDTSNYEKVSFNIEITVNKAIITVTPDANQTKPYNNIPTTNLTYTATGTVLGQKAAFTGNLAYNGGESTGSHAIIVGSLSLADSGAFEAANYNLVLSETTVYFVITKATPVVSRNPSAADITYGAALSTSSLTGGSVEGGISGSFRWVNPSAVPTVINTGYAVFFEPTDSENYNNSAHVTVSVAVAKATPDYTAPAPLTVVLKDGLKLSNVELPTGWSWTTPESTELKEAKAYTFKAKYTPADLDNFIEVENIDVIVNVTKSDTESETVTVMDEKSGIKAELTGAFETSDGTPVSLREITLKVVEQSRDSTAFNNAKALLGNGKVKFMLYDISLFSGKNKVQPVSGSKVTVSLPIPEDYKTGNLKIYYIDDSSEAHSLPILEIENGFAKFEASNFSYYALADELGTSSADESPENSKTGEAFPYGVIALQILLFCVVIIGTAIRKRTAGNRC